MFLKNLFAKQASGIGIEIAAERINVAEIRKHGQKLKLNQLSSIEIPEGMLIDGQIVDSPGIAELIQQALAQKKIKAKKVATSVSGRDAVIRLIRVPAELDDKDLRDMVLEHEAGLYLPYPREEADVDYQKLNFIEDEDGIEKVNVLLVATRKEITDVYISTFKEAGLEIDILEISSFALIRTIRDQLRQFSSQEAVVLVDIEFDTTEIAIIVDGIPEFNRSVPIGAYQLQSTLSRAMNLPSSRNIELLQGMTIPDTPADNMGTGMTSINPGMAALVRHLGELADELRRSIDFYLNSSDNKEVAQILLAGLAGGVSRLDEFFTERLSVPTTQIDPISALSIEMSENIDMVKRPALGVVLGLGLREI